MNRFVYFLVAGSILVLPISNTFSQSASLESVVVVGELQEKSVQHTQSSVSVISGESLQQRGSETLYDHVEKLANVNSVFGDKGFAIRGVTQYGVGGGSDDGTNGLINIAIDGVALPTIISSIYGADSNWDLQQVEVFRGAQSTQQGRNSLSGAVLIKTKDPHFNDESKYRLSMGQDGQTDLAFARNVPLNDLIALRFSAQHSQTDGYVKNTTLEDNEYDAREFDNFRLKLKLEPNDDLFVVAGINYSEHRGGADLVLANEFPQRRVIPSDAVPDQGSKHVISHVRLNYFFNDSYRLDSTTTYYHHQFDRQEDTDYSEVPGNLFLLQTEDDSFSQELKLHFDWNNDTGGVIGAYYTKINNEYDQDVTLPFNRAVSPEVLIDQFPEQVASVADFLNLDLLSLVDSLSNDALTLQPLQYATQETSNSAVYGELNFRFSERWSTTFGLRYDSEKIVRDSTAGTKAFVKQVPQFEFEFLPQSASSNNTRFEAFLPKWQFNYRFHKENSLALVVQRAYRAGGVQRNPISLTINEYDPEYTDNYELALRSHWFDNKLTLNANIFYTDWKDMQVPVFGQSGNQFDFDTVNAGRANLQGMEVEMRAIVLPSLNVLANLGYVETEFTEFNRSGTDLKGNQFAFAPKESATLALQYQVFSALSWQISASYQGKHFNSVTNNKAEQLPGRTLFNSELLYAGNSWSVALVGKNLTNKDYETQFFNDGTQLLARVGDPRFFGIVFNKHYDG